MNVQVGDVGHGTEDSVVGKEVDMDADGLQTLDDWGNLTVVQVDPDDGGDDAGDGVGQEVAQTETGNVLDDKRIDDHSQRKAAMIMIGTWMTV